MPLLLLLAGLVVLDRRGAMGIAANLSCAACIGNAADPTRRLEPARKSSRTRLSAPTNGR
ncbi:hypothetical protein CK220_21705 [Mesorhizobium sp. WSM3860]|nr:hypothetical protein CK220_21705 [Mesorhizobium sp. WSM3860]